MGSLFPTYGPYGTFGTPFGTDPNSARNQLLGGLKPKSLVHRGFETCLSRIELDPTRVTEAKQHYNAVKSWLESRMNATVRRVGSFQRHTKIRPTVENGVVSPIDIDAVVCFGDVTHFTSYGGTSAGSALEQVRAALTSNRTYHLLDPEIDHPVVTLSYANEFFLELIPCFKNRIPPDNTFRDPASYYVTNSAGGWEIADYDFDSQYISAANKDCDGKLVPAIKLLKHFARNRHIGLKSFQIEVLAALLLKPYFKVAPQNFPDWEWQDVLIFFLEVAPALLNNYPSIPGSQTAHIPVENLAFVQSQLTEWSQIFQDLNKLDDSQEKLKLFKMAFGAPFPAAL